MKEEEEEEKREKDKETETETQRGREAEREILQKHLLQTKKMVRKYVNNTCVQIQTRAFLFIFIFKAGMKDFSTIATATGLERDWPAKRLFNDRHGD